MSDEKKNDLPKDPVNGPITEQPTEPKSEVEIAQEDGQVTHHASVDGPVVVAQRHGMFGSSLGNDTSGVPPTGIWTTDPVAPNDSYIGRRGCGET